MKEIQKFPIWEARSISDGKSDTILKLKRWIEVNISIFRFYRAVEFLCATTFCHCSLSIESKYAALVEFPICKSAKLDWMEIDICDRVDFVIYLSLQHVVFPNRHLSTDHHRLTQIAWRVREASIKAGEVFLFSVKWSFFLVQRRRMLLILYFQLKNFSNFSFRSMRVSFQRRRCHGEYTSGSRTGI